MGGPTPKGVAYDGCDGTSPTPALVKPGRWIAGGGPKSWNAFFALLYLADLDDSAIGRGGGTAPDPSLLQSNLDIVHEVLYGRVTQTSRSFNDYTLMPFDSTVWILQMLSYSRSTRPHSTRLAELRLQQTNYRSYAKFALVYLLDALVDTAYCSSPSLRISIESSLSIKGSPYTTPSSDHST